MSLLLSLLVVLTVSNADSQTPPLWGHTSERRASSQQRGPEAYSTPKITQLHVPHCSQKKSPIHPRAVRHPLPKHLYLRLVGGGPGRDPGGHAEGRKEFSSFSRPLLCGERGLDPELAFSPCQEDALAALGSIERETRWPTRMGTPGPRPSLLSGCQPLALSCTIPSKAIGSPLGLTLLPLPDPAPRGRAPACLVLTPDPLTPALALAGRRALLNLQRYLLSWGDLRSGELEK